MSDSIDSNEELLEELKEVRGETLSSAFERKDGLSVDEKEQQERRIDTEVKESYKNFTNKVLNNSHVIAVCLIAAITFLIVIVLSLYIFNIHNNEEKLHNVISEIVYTVLLSLASYLYGRPKKKD